MSSQLLGLRVVSAAAPVQVRITTEDHPHWLAATTEVMRDSRVIAASVRKLPKLEPERRGTCLYCWHVIENNSISSLFGAPEQFLEMSRQGRALAPFLERVFAPADSTAPLMLAATAMASVQDQLLASEPRPIPRRTCVAEVRQNDYGVGNHSTVRIHTITGTAPRHWLSILPSPKSTLVCHESSLFLFTQRAQDVLRVDSYDPDGAWRWSRDVKLPFPVSQDDVIGGEVSEGETKFEGLLKASDRPKSVAYTFSFSITQP